jgi:hypothetical protein
MSIRGNRVCVFKEESLSVKGWSPEAVRLNSSEFGRERSDRENYKGRSRKEESSTTELVFENPLFVHEPGLDRFCAKDRAMASAGNGGEQGGADEAPTHPKLPVGDESDLPRGQGGRAALESRRTTIG